jgi:glycerophosphoryl diester phosphodiesterase
VKRSTLKCATKHAIKRATGEAATPFSLHAPLIIGHRGSSKVAPENTLAAFERALQDGADGIEFDVRLARDGVPVVIHDATLRRTGRIDARIASLSASELGATDVGSWFNRRFPQRARPEYTREVVPTLSRVFERVAAGCRVLYVELKCEGGEITPLVERVIADVRTAGVESRVVIESFNLDVIRETKRLARQPERVFLSPRSLLRKANACLADELALQRSLVNRRTVEAAASAGLHIVVWTVDQPSWIKRALSLGLRAVITNDPAGMRAALSRCCEQTEAQNVKV